MNRERNILKLMSDDECLLAGSEAFINANNHLKSAESIAINKNYGLAVSLLILSTEELVKGLLLYFQSMKIDVRNVSGIHLFFTDHIIKHRLASIINLTFPLFKLLGGFIHKTVEKIHNPESLVEFTEDEKALITINENRLQYLFKDLDEFLDWWEEANINKNKGIYIDYSNSLETPMQVTEIEYLQAFKIAVNFHTQMSEILSFLERTTEEDKMEFAKNEEKYQMGKLLSPIIDARKKEIKNKNDMKLPLKLK